MQRIAEALARALAVAAVPVLVVGCSSDSGGSGSSGKGDDSPTARPPASSSSSPSLAPARFTRLPDPCKALASGTVGKLVPKAKDKSGDAAKSPDVNSRASCSWNGLDGFQYRWLDVSFSRTDSTPGLGSAEDQAKTAFGKLKTSTATPEDLKKGSDPAIREAGIGDESQLVSAVVVQDDEDYRDVTVIVRSSNVVITAHYNGAGFEGEKNPSAETVEEGALKAAKEALAKLG